MLSVLQIENIATIETASVEFSSGLNILTGETGAGKSILIDAINAVLGAKTSRELIRTGENSASVSALFSGIGKQVENKLAEMGLPIEEDGTLQIRRTMYKDGKNACYLNGTPITVSMLRSIAIDLINIHGQRDSQALLQTDRHVDFLDAFAGDKAQRSAYYSCFSECRNLKKELAALQMDEAEKARRLDLLQFQVDELQVAAIREGEIEALRHKKNIIQNAAKVKNAIAGAIRSLVGAEEEIGADTLLKTAVTEILSVSDVASGLGEIAGQLEAAKETVSEAAAVLDDAISQIGGDEEELDKIEERLDLLFRLSRKYGATETEMLSFLQNAETELQKITFADERSAELSAQLLQKETQLSKLAEELSAVRHDAGERLAAEICAELSFLDMPNVQFVVQITPCAYQESGADTVHFLLSANPGEAPKPLDRVASGGELSRVMLAMKNVLRTGPDASAMIFDEIDAGVSGRAAGKIAQRLAALATDGQVLCVTHSAQIASFADVHKLISKSVQNGKTYTKIETLSPERRAVVLAEITYGAEPSALQVDSSRQMILQADLRKRELRAENQPMHSGIV